MRVDCINFSFKLVSLKILGSDHDNEIFDFIRILTQVIDNFSKISTKQKII
jgi:hypothetical protein